MSQIRCTLVLSSSSRSLASEPFAISVDYKLFLFEPSDECVSLYHVLFYRNVNGCFFYQKDSHMSSTSLTLQPPESRLQLAEESYCCPPTSPCVTTFSSEVKILGGHASPHEESGINIMRAYISCLLVFSVHAKRARINT